MVPSRFVFDLSSEFSKTLLLDGFRQMLVFHHPLYIQIFHTDKTWFSFYDRTGHLMQMVPTDIRQPLADLQKLLFSFYKVTCFPVTFPFLIFFLFSRYGTL